VIAFAFGVVCIPIFVIALFIFVRAMLEGVRVARRANAIVPVTLLSQVRFAQIDAKRAAKAFKETGALAPRAALAIASILASIETYRAYVARLRGLA